MSARSEHPFGNEDAMDFVCDLATNPAKETRHRITEALLAATHPDPTLPLDTNTAAVAIAAAALIAAGTDPSRLPDHIADELADRLFEPDHALRHLALTAVDRATGTNSDLVWTWADHGTLTAFHDHANQLRADLHHTAIPANA